MYKLMEISNKLKHIIYRFADFVAHQTRTKSFFTLYVLSMLK